jgi:hypothetical protein
MVASKLELHKKKHQIIEFHDVIFKTEVISLWIDR